MAIYRFSSQMISKSSGRSAVAAAAYRAADCLLDEEIAKKHNYTQKKGVHHSEIMYPENSKIWSREELWNEVTRAEKRKDSQLSREIQIAIPKELEKKLFVPMIKEFVQDNFVDKGMIADFSIHIDNPNNPHAHIMLTTRNVSHEGFGKKNRTWNDKNLLREWRKNWEIKANDYLLNAGFDERIDHRSYADRGIFLLPAKKVYDYKPKNDAFSVIKPKIKYGKTELEQVENVIDFIDRLDYFSRLEKEENRLKRNLEIIRNDPSVMLRILTENNAIITEKEINNYLIGLDASTEEIEEINSKIKSDDLLLLIDREIDNETKESDFTYTTKRNIGNEIDIIKSANELINSKATYTISEKLIKEIGKNFTFDDAQNEVYQYSNLDKNLIVINGVAGSGKSYIMKAVKETHSKRGYNIIGLSSTGSAVENLEKSTGIKSQTIASFNLSRKELKKDDLIIIDESSMASSEELVNVLKNANKAKSKIILLGDVRQLSSVGAGRAFESIVNNIDGIDINSVRRQKNVSHKKATLHLMNQEISKALKIYKDENSIMYHEKLDLAKIDMMSSWIVDKMKDLNSNSMMLAYSRKNAQHLNLSAHETLKTYDLLKGTKETIETDQYGSLEILNGEEIVFTKNDKNLGVKNGTHGVIKEIGKSEITVSVNDSEITLSKNRKLPINYNYAKTIHKSQGETYDKSYLLLTRAMTSKSSYVAMTRHKKDIEIHWSLDNFSNGKDVSKTLSRTQDNTTALNVVSANYQEYYGAKIVEDIAKNTPVIKKIKKEVSERKLKPSQTSKSNPNLSI